MRKSATCLGSKTSRVALLSALSGGNKEVHFRPGSKVSKDQAIGRPEKFNAIKMVCSSVRRR